MKSREYLFKIGLNLLTGVFIVGSIGLIFYWYQYSETSDLDELKPPGRYRIAARKIGEDPDAIRIRVLTPTRPLKVDYYNKHFLVREEDN